jgi:hypothetical protein
VVLDSFDEQIQTLSQRWRYASVGGMGFAMSQAMTILLQALMFYWSGTLISHGVVVSLRKTIVSGSRGRLIGSVPRVQSTIAVFACYEAILTAVSRTPSSSFEHIEYD